MEGKRARVMSENDTRGIIQIIVPEFLAPYETQKLVIGLISEATAVIREESIPPLRNEQTGTSEIIRS